MVREGITVEEARSKIWMYDVHGLIVDVSFVFVTHVKELVNSKASLMFTRVLEQIESKYALSFIFYGASTSSISHFGVWMRET